MSSTEKFVLIGNWRSLLPCEHGIAIFISFFFGESMSEFLLIEHPKNHFWALAHGFSSIDCRWFFGEWALPTIDGNITKQKVEIIEKVQRWAITGFLPYWFFLHVHVIIYWTHEKVDYAIAIVCKYFCFFLTNNDWPLHTINQDMGILCLKIDINI